MLHSGSPWGALAALVVTLGWNLLGPFAIASVGVGGTRRLYVESSAARLVAFLFLLPVLVFVARIIAPQGYFPTVLLMATAISTAGLSPLWYAVSTGQFRVLLLFDAGPRLLAVVLSAILLLAGAPINAFPIVLMTLSLGGSVVFLLKCLRNQEAPTLGLVGRVTAWIPRLATATLSEVATGSFAAGAVTFVSLGTSLSALATYASGDRIFRLILYSVATLCNALQFWVTTGSGLRRFRISLYLHVVLGLCGCLVLSLSGSSLTALMFGSSNAADNVTCFGLGIAFLMASIGTSFGRHFLLVRGRLNLFLALTLVSVAIGIPAIVALSKQFGAAGGAWGVALAEGVFALSLAVVSLYSMLVECGHGE